MGKKSKITAIEVAGLTLWGPAWQEKMAQALGVTPKTVWRWKQGSDNGENDPPYGVWDDIEKLCDERIAEIEKLKKSIRASRAK